MNVNPQCLEKKKKKMHEQKLSSNIIYVFTKLIVCRMSYDKSIPAFLLERDVPNPPKTAPGERVHGLAWQLLRHRCMNGCVFGVCVG